MGKEAPEFIIKAIIWYEEVCQQQNWYKHEEGYCITFAFYAGKLSGKQKNKTIKYCCCNDADRVR